MPFRAEILDTWNTTITPVEDTFTTRPENGDMFADEHARSIRALQDWIVDG